MTSNGMNEASGPLFTPSDSTHLGTNSRYGFVNGRLTLVACGVVPIDPGWGAINVAGVVV
jgi:hypothetical protein